MMIIDYPWYFVLFCLLLGAAYAAVLYFVRPVLFTRWLRWVLAGLRFLAVSVIAFLLLAPLSKQRVTERQLPHVVLLRDVSQSVALGGDSSFSFDDLAKGLESRCHISIDSFGTAGYTDIGDALDRYRGDDVAALVLASDGIHNRGANPTTVAEKLSFPIYCVALGDTTPQRDAALMNLRCNRIAMLGNSFPVEFTVAATLLKGHEARLTVTDTRGKQLHAQTIRYDDNDFSLALTVNLTAAEPGLQRYTLRLSEAEDEASTANNVLSFYVDVIDTRQRVVIFANAPHPDLAALKRALESNPNYEAEIVLADEVERGKWKADGDISLAILHNLPSQRHPSIDYAKGLPQLYIVGLQTDLARFNALHTGLEIVAKAARTNEVTAIYQPGFSLFSLDADDADAITSLPPLAAPFGESRTSPDLQTLFSARLGSIDTRQPLVAATAQGDHRRAFIWGEGLWRWRLADYQIHQSHQHVDRLIAQLITFASLQSNRDRLQVEAERSYAAGGPIVLRAQLYNEAYQLVNDPEVKLTLRNDSLKADYTFRRTSNSYSLTLPDLPEGLYRYHASTDDGLTDDGSFAVEALNLEQQSLVADHSLLATLAALTGGEMVTPNQLSPLHASLSALKPTLYTHTRYAEMLRMPLALILILLLLTAEWVLRKYHGEL